MPSEGIKLADSRHESHAGRPIEPFGSLHELSRIQKGRAPLFSDTFAFVIFAPLSFSSPATQSDEA
jgi:hypothetical protein